MDFPPVTVGWVTVTVFVSVSSGSAKTAVPQVGVAPLTVTSFVTPPPTKQPWGTFAVFRDPDGNQFVLSGRS